MIKKRKSITLVIVVVFLCVLVVPVGHSFSSMDSSQPLSKEGWYFLPTYPNYSPQGLPDFDQSQDNWKARQGIWRFMGGLWSFCSPTSLADIFWWFDSKHEDPTGYPGDGNDSYPLVRNFNVSGVPSPGPNPDDHNFNNVNDVTTPWKHGRGAKEFIELLAWYCNTNFCQNPLIRGYAGTKAEYLEKGAKQWIEDAGLGDRYTVEAFWKPDFTLLVSRLQNNSGILINLLFCNPNALVVHTFLGHSVAVAGINPNGSIALCDPFQNRANPTPTPSEHNDANVVSYDIYAVNFTSPFPDKGSCWIQEYFSVGPWTFGGIIQYALIISENE